MEQQLIGIDVGTTGLKALVIEPSGKLIGEASAHYEVERPQPGWTEQRPERWWEACIEALSTLRRQGALHEDAVAGVGLTGQMHGSVFLDDRSEVVRPAIMWNDQRTTAECGLIEERVGAARLIALTGNRALTGFTAPKVLWLQRHEPDGFRRTRHLLLPKDYLRLRLTGEYATDVSDASGTLLFDVPTRRWSREVADALEVPWEWLPVALESPAVSGRVGREAAADHWASGGNAGRRGRRRPGGRRCGQRRRRARHRDVQHRNFRRRLRRDSEPGYRPAGTAAFVLPRVARPLAPHGRHACRRRFLPLARRQPWRRWPPIPAPSSRDWDCLANDAVPGSRGLLFLPYLAGERTPYPDPLARGAFIGLREEHGLPEMARAVMEGVTFGLRDSLELLREMGVDAREVRTIGGGSRNRLWRQILADVFRLPVAESGGRRGAGFRRRYPRGGWLRLLPGRRRGLSSDGKRPASDWSPDPTMNVSTRSMYARYREMYPSTARHVPRVKRRWSRARRGLTVARHWTDPRPSLGTSRVERDIVFLRVF